ncbi:MAG: tetratricopeptide repeat protein [Anaerolineae bacterium]|nr:tetratricopeptide repeat protein [Anaerolineae bacterium]
MYIRPQKKRKTNLWLVVFLIAAIGLSLYVYTLVEEEEIVTTVVPTPTPTRSAFSYVTEANGLYMQGEMDRAIDTYARALELTPEDVSIMVPLARLLILEERSVDAIELAERAVELAPESAPAHAVLCMAYDWAGYVTDAIEMGERAVALDPAYPEAHAYLAEAYIDANLWSEALESARRGVELGPNNVDARRDYGYVLEMVGDYWGALSEYERAVEINPNLAHIYIDMGRTYLYLVDTPSAIRSFERAVELAPNRAQALDWLGWTYRAIEEYGEAQRYLERAVAADPEYATAFGHLGHLFWERRNYESAIPNLEQAIDLAYRESRSETESFYVTVEWTEDVGAYPSLDVVMRGSFDWADAERTRRVATLAPQSAVGRWATASGEVVLNVTDGATTVRLEGMPALAPEQVYVGWLEGLRTLDDLPFNTGVLPVTGSGSLDVELLAEPVRGPRVEHFYTLGLCYYFMARCELAYPLFDAALLIYPENELALEGIRLCEESENATAP